MRDVRRRRMAGPTKRRSGHSDVLRHPKSTGMLVLRLRVERDDVFRSALVLADVVDDCGELCREEIDHRCRCVCSVSQT